MVMVFKFSELKRIDSGGPVFLKHKFHRNSSENVLRDKDLGFSIQKIFQNPLTLTCERLLALYLKLIELWSKNHQDPFFSCKFSSLTKTWFSQTVLKVLQNHSREVCVTLRQFCQCQTFLTLSKNEGHEGQKGQILKNVANCLKRMQNKNFLWNPSLNHVLTRFTIP